MCLHWISWLLWIPYCQMEKGKKKSDNNLSWKIWDNNKKRVYLCESNPTFSIVAAASFDYTCDVSRHYWMVTNIIHTCRSRKSKPQPKQQKEKTSEMSTSLVLTLEIKNPNRDRVNPYWTSSVLSSSSLSLSHSVTR